MTDPNSEICTRDLNIKQPFGALNRNFLYQTPNSVSCPKHILQFCPLRLMIAKGKAIPLQALTGSEGSRRLRLPDFKTLGT
jgi:hypothetical protein